MDLKFLGISIHGTGSLLQVRGSAENLFDKISGIPILQVLLQEPSDLFKKQTMFPLEIGASAEKLIQPNLRLFK